MLNRWQPDADGYTRADRRGRTAVTATSITPVRDLSVDGVEQASATAGGSASFGTVRRWVGLFLLAIGLLSVANAGFLATQAGGPSGVDVAWVALLTLGIAGAAIVLPWPSWPHVALLGLATASLALLVLIDVVSAYSRTSQAAATYPIYVVLILAWVGFTQPRRTALAFALCAGSALALVVLLRADSAIPLSALAVIVPAGAALGEAVSWVMAELRAAARRGVLDGERLASLARVLDRLPRQAHLGAAAQQVADAACALFESPAAHVLLLDDDGETLAATSGSPALVAALDARTDLARRLLHPPEDGPTDPDAFESDSDAANQADHEPGDEPDHEAAALQRSPGRSGRHHGTARRTAARRARRIRIRTGPTAGALRVRDGGLVLTLAGPRRVVGVVALAPPRQASIGQEPLARLFASQVGTVLEQFETIRSLDHAVRHDELTGTGNRRHATELLAGLRPGDGLILVDIDHFKAVNDREGHRGGDRLLRALGEYLRTCVRDSDNVARFGGDEFIVVARGLGTDAAAAAGRLLEGWRELGTSATVSIGVAVHTNATLPEDTLDRADKALYQAKAQGRNRLVAWS